MAGASNEQPIRDLYDALPDRWTNGDASRMAALRSTDGSVIGFNGSTMNGRAEMAATLGQIFANHKTASYVSIVREVRLAVRESDAWRIALFQNTPAAYPGRPEASEELTKELRKALKEQ